MFFVSDQINNFMDFKSEEVDLWRWIYFTYGMVQIVDL